MAGYLVLARKYRSTTFDEVVGQEPVAQTLRNAIAGSRVAHAYLFTGARGVGKTTMARIFAKALNCLSADAPTVTPCNRCDACVAIGRGDDVDVVEIDGASNRGIDQIRELRANAIFRPSRSRYKVYYIDEVHMLTKEAFNALLKTLEEPPEHVKFIFATTEVEKVPATILSRCQRFDFRNIPARLIAQHLQNLCTAEKVQAETDALFRVARSAGGSMRDALSLLDQLLAAGGGQVAEADVIRILGTPADERTLAIVSAIAEGNSSRALGELDAVLEAGATLSTVMGALCEVFRNLMIVSTCGADSDLLELSESQKKAVVDLSGRFSLPTLVQAVGILNSVSRSIRGSSVARSLAEAALVRLAEAEKFVDPTSLLERIDSAATVPGDVKKKPTLSDNPASPAGRFSPAPPQVHPPAAAAPTLVVQWDAAWLSAHWALVVQHFVDKRQMRLAGAIRPARVMGLDNGELRLGFEPSHEGLMHQCEGPLKDAIAAAMSELAGKNVRCRCEKIAAAPAAAAPVGAEAPSVAPPPQVALSTAEKNEITRDASVKAMLGLFGGDIADIRRREDAAQKPSQDKEPE